MVVVAVSIARLVLVGAIIQMSAYILNRATEWIRLSGHVENLFKV